jgi:RimJ/RimL family protein N-acetyltransferase
MIIRKVKKKDLLEIFIWRNDKKTVFFSKEKKKISLKNHIKWFNNNLRDSRTKFYIGYLIKKNKEKKVGIVRFDIKNKYALVSININPIMRNKRLSFILLSNSIKKFLRFNKFRLIAEIKNNNLASLKCFLKNKFYFFKSNKQYSFYQRLLS